MSSHREVRSPAFGGLGDTLFHFLGSDELAVLPRERGAFDADVGGRGGAAGLGLSCQK